MRFAYLIAFALAVVSIANGHDVITTNLTYTRDISRIFARHCAACHAAGSSIPLTNYEEVRPWAVSIKEQVLRRRMPPWGAVKGFGGISPDRGLSQEDIMIIAAWVIGGAPKGSTGLLPPSKSTEAAVKKPPLQDGLTIETKQKLREAILAAGIRPLAPTLVISARVTARLPDGRIEPLVWLYQYDPKFPQTFTFRKPLELPAGTEVESSAPLRFAVECEATVHLQAQ